MPTDLVLAITGRDNPNRGSDAYAALARPEWMTDANCRRSGVNFWPGQGQDVREALAVCEACPVREPCLALALERREYGIWGGTTEIARKKMRSQRRRSAA